MKILIVSYEDDNFGDNLIRICFESLLKVVLKNLGLNRTEYQIKKMPLKKIDKELVEDADIITFAGGGLFGLSYLGFYEYLNEITEIADEKGIPVIFSSIGVNNMDAKAEVEKSLNNLLHRKCIFAVSVRENIELFKKYTEKCSFAPEQVCDPAVWTQYVYNMDTSDKNLSHAPIGVNVVRGGLFRDNGKDWGLKDELQLLSELKEYFEKTGQDYRFYTNGSVFDNNTLHYFEREHSVPHEKCIYSHTTKEVVETVASFKSIITFRMHSSIIAYSFGIPSIALVWNDKIPFFYKNIGHSDRILYFEDWNSRILSEKLESVLSADSGKEEVDQNYLMSLYTFLYNTFKKLVLINNKDDAVMPPVYSFERVKEALAVFSGEIDYESFDLHLKLEKAEKHYLHRFTDLRKKNKELEEQKKELLKNRKLIETLKKENDQLKEQICQRETELKEINSWISVRFIKYFRRKYRKIIPLGVRKKLKKLFHKK